MRIVKELEVRSARSAVWVTERVFLNTEVTENAEEEMGREMGAGLESNILNHSMEFDYCQGLL